MEDIKEKVVKHMVNRFLGWKLPEDFHPDCGITFNREYNNGTEEGGVHEPIGTNLFTAQQAEDMIRYMVEGYMDTTRPADRPLNQERE